MPADAFFSAFKLDREAELTSPLLLTAAQAAKIPLSPRAVGEAKQEDAEKRKTESGCCERGSPVDGGPTGGLDARMTGADGRLKNDETHRRGGVVMEVGEEEEAGGGRGSLWGRSEQGRRRGLD